MRKKIKRFQENAQRDNVIQEGKANYYTCKGNWKSTHFNNLNDITLELGCGQGEYTISLAKLFPNRNFIGIDIKGARLWVGSTQAIHYNLANVAFLRTAIEQLDQFFEPGEVAEIYIPFPDPRPRQRDMDKRLTSPRFLELYRHILKPGGLIHLKTDDLHLFLYTLETLSHQPDVQILAYTDDLYHSDWLPTQHGVTTKYETRFISQGATIKYINFTLGK